MDTLPVRLPRQCSGMETGANQCIHLLSGARRISRGPAVSMKTASTRATRWRQRWSPDFTHPVPTSARKDVVCRKLGDSCGALAAGRPRGFLDFRNR